jgi:anti-sigma-K factor RskA
MNDPRTHQCDAYAENLSELALGILTGRERAATLAHVDICAHCAEELEQLARAADAVVRVAPEAEPPMGFEVRLFERMGVADTPPRRRGTARRLAATPRWALAVAAAVVALAIGLSIGWNTGPDRGPGPTTVTHPHAPEVAAADLTDHGRPVGRVATFGGTNPWMTVTLDDGASHGLVICEVVTGNGVTHTVGTFTARDGYGSWGAALRVAPHDVRKALVVSSNGQVIGTAVLS